MADGIACAVCGRSLGVTVAAFRGIKINLPTSPVDKAEEAEMRDYCFPCLLAALGIKPPDTSG